MINLKDLLNSNKDGSDKIETVGEAEAKTVAETVYEPVYEPEPEPPVQEANPLGRPAYRPEDTGTVYEEDVPPPQPVGVSLISREATVLGDIITEGHIDVVGKVRGNVEAEGNIAVCGLVSGNLTGEKIGLYQCRVKGDLKAGTGVVIDSDSVIIGDVETDNLVLGGKLKGDIKALKMAVLRSDAYFIGDVLTESLAVESGAVVNGNIKTIVHGDPEAPFND